MKNNPFNDNVTYENDLDGLILPYKLVSRTDKEVITEKYMKLRKSSYGYIIRLGIPESR